MTSAPAIRITGLTKSYPTGLLHHRRRPVLHGLDLEVSAGEIFGYLGPNGSGKTTTLKILVGLMRADAGTIEVLGHPHADPEWRTRLGYLPEHPYLYDYLTPIEYVEYAGRLQGLDAPTRRARARSLIERVGLGRFAGQPMRRFSKGMLQKVGVAQALVAEPELVILDEPMSGLDPFGRRMMREIILDLRKKGATVLFSTHILGDAEQLCDRVALIDQGKLVASGRLGDILKLDVSALEVLVTGVSEEVLDTLGAAVRERRAVGGRWDLQVPERSLGAVIAGVESAGGRVLSVLPLRQSLEDYFMKEVGSTAQPWEVAD